MTTHIDTREEAETLVAEKTLSWREALASRSKSAFIGKPYYDILFFLGPPAMALVLGILLSGSWLDRDEYRVLGHESTLLGIFLGTFIHAHLFIVFFRSHGNADVRRLHPYRFLLVPAVLFVAMLWSPWVLVCVSVLATFWDVYHSGLQTFGIARIYDRRAGNDPKEGRLLDLVLNHLLYAGPIVAGATMLAHFEDFEEFKDVGDTFFTQVPAFMDTNQAYFTWAILLAGTAFLVYYVVANLRMIRAGRNISPQKVWLLASTGFCSIYTWGFNSWGMAFFIMNFFHALQYFGLVWLMERKNIQKTMRLDQARYGKLLAWLVLVGVGAAYGSAVEFISGVEWFYALTLVVSIMHFWYDGFIWSVQKGQVAK